MIRIAAAGAGGTDASNGLRRHSPNSCEKTPRSQAPRYYLRAPIIGALASQARHDCCPQSPMIRGVLSPGLVGGW
ncbi:hypothetical protein CFM90_18355 (plasmid) [Ralstonia solanacearum]|nr:hypothetical protein CFM90_18355 [Ralstonia solanacearum]